MRHKPFVVCSTHVKAITKNMKRFLLLQLRPEDEVSDDEFEKFLKYGNLSRDEVHRVRMDQGHLPDINLDDYSAVIVGGGPDCVSSDESHKSEAQKKYEPWLHTLLNEITRHDFPYLGCCYGLGALTLNRAGRVSKEKYSEPVHGIDVTLTEEGGRDPLLAGLPKMFRAFVGHKEACQKLPESAALLATGEACPVQMIRMGKNVYAVQFHPESDPESFILRVNAYKHLGYFPIEDVQKLIEEIGKETITVPQEILQRFVERYRRSYARH